MERGGSAVRLRNLLIEPRIDNSFRPRDAVRCQPDWLRQFACRDQIIDGGATEARPLYEMRNRNERDGVHEGALLSIDHGRQTSASPLESQGENVHIAASGAPALRRSLRLDGLRSYGVCATVAGIALGLAACAHTPRPALVQDFPPAPVELNAALPKPSVLPPNATLGDIMRAHLADSEAFQQLAAEVRTWRAWWADQAAENSKR